MGKALYMIEQAAKGMDPSSLVDDIKKIDEAGQDDVTMILTNLDTIQDSIAGTQKRLMRMSKQKVVDPKSDSLFHQLVDKIDKMGFIVVKARNMLNKIVLK